MKRRAISISLLLFSVLVLCTGLSLVLERQMTAQVVTATISGTTEQRIPLSAAIIDETGEIHVYEAVEGIGLERGLYAREISPNEYVLDENGIVFRSGISHKVILRASKTIVEESAVENTQERPDGEAYYLVTNNGDDVMLEEKAGQPEIAAQNARAVLLSAQGKSPYLEAGVRDTLGIPGRYAICNLSAVRLFYTDLPLLSVACVLLMGFLTALIGLCRGISRPGREKASVIGLACLVPVLLAAFFFVIARIDLPDCMMPGDSAFEFGYYLREMSAAAKSIALLEHPMLLELAGHSERCLKASGAILLVGFLLVAGSPIAVRKVGRRRGKRLQKGEKN